jgi:UDPglucose 6-dehydrogenase
VIGFAGLSHLGIVSAVAAAAKGAEVLAFDADAHLIEDLRRGVFPIVEPELPDTFSKNKQRIRFSTDLASLGNCELVVFFPSTFPRIEITKATSRRSLD